MPESMKLRRIYNAIVEISLSIATASFTWLTVDFVYSFCMIYTWDFYTQA